MPAGYLLDTNVVLELRKGEQTDPGVRGWFDQHADDALWLSVLVVGELQRGCELLRRRDQRAGDALLAWLETITIDFADRILPVTTGVAKRWTELNVPDPMPLVDGLLAATAIEHDLTLVTRNTPDVERTGVPVENPFSGDAEAHGSGDSGESHAHIPRFGTDGSDDLDTEAAHPTRLETPVGQEREASHRSQRPRPGTRSRPTRR